jgi:hypothetical protein
MTKIINFPLNVESEVEIESSKEGVVLNIDGEHVSIKASDLLFIVHELMTCCTPEEVAYINTFSSLLTGFAMKKTPDCRENEALVNVYADSILDYFQFGVIPQKQED